MKRKPYTWTDSMVHSELLPICAATGVFPSNSDLTQMGRSDLANQICDRGGFVAWAKKMGFNRNKSDSDTGWEGEAMAIELLTKQGFKAEKTDQIRAPYDILVEGCLRVDVKSAKYAQYGASSGWFYRIGKHPQCDLLMLFQMDTGTAYYLPWYVCPTTNITISKNGGVYSEFKNNICMVVGMAQRRCEERVAYTALKKERPST